MEDIFASQQDEKVVKPKRKKKLKEIDNELETDIYKCPNCGNFLNFDPASQKLMCSYCRTEIETVPCGSAREIYYTEQSEIEFEDWDGVKSIKCNSCGVEIVLNKYQTAMNCPFCNASNIVVQSEVKGIKPNAILPFKITKDDAVGACSKWLKKKIFAPNDLRKKAKTDNFKGVYIPVWTFDCYAESPYEARVGDRYTVTVGSGKNRRTETRIRWRMVRGFVKGAFDDITVEASLYIDQKDLRKVGGFDTENSVSYHKQFISGFEAERYSKGLDESWQSATQLVSKELESMARSEIVADVIDYVRLNPSFSERKYKYVLVPIWFTDYLYHKKHYGIIVNGRSARATGSAPVSVVKALIAAIVGSGVLAGIIYLILMFM